MIQNSEPEENQDSLERFCLKFGTVVLVITFLMAIRFMMGLRTISFSLRIDIYNFPWNSENV